MDTIVGVFRSIEAARGGVSQLTSAGFRKRQLSVLFPGASEEEIHSIPTSDTEQPGMGGAMGGVVGAALGMAGGFELGAGVALLIPGVGPVLAIGIAGAALFGVGGAFGGTALGEAAEQDSTVGVPADEVFFYEDALRQGRSLVIVMPKNAAEAEKARKALALAEAESLDAAREAWWIGLRDAEEEHYRALGENFAKDQDTYREGFIAGLRPECRGKTLAEAEECLRNVYPDLWDTKPFRAGFERGLAHRQRVEADAARSKYLVG